MSRRPVRRQIAVSNWSRLEERDLLRREGTMRRIIVVLTILVTSGMWMTVAQASIARGGGGGARPSVGNRSAGNINRGNINRGNINRGNVNAGNINRGNVNRGNVNRGNVNRQFNNANINRNVNANGWGNHYVADPHWGWGSFAGGAAAAATGAAVGSAIANRNEAVAAPEAGMVVSSLPAGCSGAGGSCDGVNYQPSFDGSNVVYQVQPQ